MMYLRQNKMRLYLAVLIAVLLIASGYLLVSQTFGKVSSAPTPPPSANRPPIYPNATNVVTNFTSTYRKLASFETSDPAADVQRYYEDLLQNDGWTVDTVSKPETPDSLYFSWGGHPGDYDMSITISSPTDGLLNVKITLVAHNIQL